MTLGSGYLKDARCIRPLRSPSSQSQSKGLIIKDPILLE